MRTLQLLIKFVFFALLVAAGVLVIMYPTAELWKTYTETVSDPNPLVRQIVAGVFAAMAVISYLPLWPGGRSSRNKRVSFQGTHGEVDIELEPAEATLERIIARLPEVKNVSISLKPLDSPGSVRVLAAAVLMKDADTDARIVTARVNSFIQNHTRKILGLQDVTVKINVRRWVMNMKSVKPEPLLLEGPTSPNVQPSSPGPANQSATVMTPNSPAPSTPGPDDTSAKPEEARA